MIVVAQGNEAKRLQAGALELAHRLQHFGHAVDRTGVGMEGNLYEVAGGKLLGQLQQPAGDGNGLEFRARLLAAFNLDGRGHRSVQLDSRCTPVGEGLGEVGHSQVNYAIAEPCRADYQSACTGSRATGFCAITFCAGFGSAIIT